jgi:hypothetical protein
MRINNTACSRVSEKEKSGGCREGRRREEWQGGNVGRGFLRIEERPNKSSRLMGCVSRSESASRSESGRQKICCAKEKG